MNFRQVLRLLGIVSFLLGGCMLFSLPWAFPSLGTRTSDLAENAATFETRGFVGLLVSFLLCLVVGVSCWLFAGQPENDGRGDGIRWWSIGPLYRKEAMASVGLTWVLATILGALPFYFSSTYRLPGAAGGDTATKMSFVDALFESQSGFSTTGATVISELEDPRLVPHCILFWRSTTHFLGGLGIIVLFVAILGQGSAGKTLMRAELPGPTHDDSQTRIRQAAVTFAGVYLGLTALLTGLLKLCGLTWFDSICHAFGTMATGGFSTYNASLGHFQSAKIDYLVIVFMILAGTNFTLLILAMRGKPSALFADVEFRTYLGIMAVATLFVVGFGWAHGDFSHDVSQTAAEATVSTVPSTAANAVRYGLFHVVSIMTTTGFGTHDFDQWNDVSRAVLLLLMFIGGCAGSTGGGIKVIRILLLAKVQRLEIERAFHPTVVRPLRIGGQPVKSPELRIQVLVYVTFIVVIFLLSWLAVVVLEPASTWRTESGQDGHHLFDSASIVAATLNNIGPGFGTVGATRNYGHLTSGIKLLCTWLMMLGRLEIYVILCLFAPRFWRTT